MDWSNPVSAGISAGGSLLGGLFSSWANRRLIKQQQRYNTSERIASQDWQNQQREAQNQYSEDMYNKYSSPQALVQQYNDAGLNPRLAAEGGQVGSVQASSGTSGGAPSGAMGSMPYIQSPDFTQGFVNMANVLKSIAEARKAGAETDKIEKMLNVEFDRANIAKEAEQFALNMNIKYQDHERFIQLAIAMNQEGITAQERKNLEEQFKALCYDNDVRKFNVDRLVDRWFWEEQKNIVEVGQGQARVENIEEDTSLKRLMQQTEKQYPRLYSALADVHEKTAGLLDLDLDTAAETHAASKNLTAHQYRNAEQAIDKQLDYLEQQLELAEKNNDSYYTRIIMDCAAEIIGTAVAIGMYRQGSRSLDLQAARFNLESSRFQLLNTRPAKTGYIQ